MAPSLVSYVYAARTAFPRRQRSSSSSAPSMAQQLGPTLDGVAYSLDAVAEYLVLSLPAFFHHLGSLHSQEASMVLRPRHPKAALDVIDNTSAPFLLLAEAEAIHHGSTLQKPHEGVAAMYDDIAKDVCSIRTVFSRIEDGAVGRSEEGGGHRTSTAVVDLLRFVDASLPCVRLRGLIYRVEEVLRVAATTPPGQMSIDLSSLLEPLGEALNELPPAYGPGAAVADEDTAHMGRWCALVVSEALALCHGIKALAAVGRSAFLESVTEALRLKNALNRWGMALDSAARPQLGQPEGWARFHWHIRFRWHVTLYEHLLAKMALHLQSAILNKAMDCAQYSAISHCGHLNYVDECTKFLRSYGATAQVAVVITVRKAAPEGDGYTLADCAAWPVPAEDKELPPTHSSHGFRPVFHLTSAQACPPDVPATPAQMQQHLRQYSAGYEGRLRSSGDFSSQGLSSQTAGGVSGVSTGGGSEDTGLLQRQQGAALPAWLQDHLSGAMALLDSEHSSKVQHPLESPQSRPLERGRLVLGGRRASLSLSSSKGSSGSGGVVTYAYHSGSRWRGNPQQSSFAYFVLQVSAVSSVIVLFCDRQKSASDKGVKDFLSWGFNALSDRVVFGPP